MAASDTDEWPSSAPRILTASDDTVTLCTRRGLILSIFLAATAAAVASIATAHSSSVCGPSGVAISSGATHMAATADGQLVLHHHGVPVLLAAAVPTSSVSVQPAGRALEEDGELQSPHPRDCIVLVIASGGTLDVDIASGGHWYGGPAMAQGYWPASRGRVTRQRWRSNDMLADREKLGSVLEATWLSSSGAVVRVLPAAGGAPSNDFYFTFNTPCDATTSSFGGRMCIQNTVDANDVVARPLRVEMCTAPDVRAAHIEHIIGRVPRPLSPQPPSLQVLRAPVWSTWARFKMGVDQAKVETYAAEIVAHGFPRSHLEVDDKWSTSYGDMQFDSVKFPRPQEMVARLRELGFTVTLWITPFAEPRSEAYEEGRRLGYWLRRPDGAPEVVTWWQGDGAALNVSQPEALRWMEQVCAPHRIPPPLPPSPCLTFSGRRMRAPP